MGTPGGPLQLPDLLLASSGPDSSPPPGQTLVWQLTRPSLTEPAALGILMAFESAQVGNETSLPPCFLHSLLPALAAAQGCLCSLCCPPSRPSHQSLPAWSPSLFLVPCQVQPGFLPLYSLSRSLGRTIFKQSPMPGPGTLLTHGSKASPQSKSPLRPP